jgi:histidyl-tRNA synthetase
MISKPRGTRDFLPDEMEKRKVLENIMRDVAERYGYREVSTPTFEHLELFTKKSGESILKEIYHFKDKSGRDLALRPELTAAVTRMILEECHAMPRPLRFYYFSNCFRYERPQKGRYREFWQFGVELVGSSMPQADVEVIALAYDIMKSAGVDFSLHVGHVGILRDMLKDFKGETAQLMRLIDKKDHKGLQESLESLNAPEELIEKTLTFTKLLGGPEILDEAETIAGSSEHIDYLRGVCEMLDLLKLDYSVDLGIARGLDYYTGVVFEAYAEGLGAQNQICGGGSYRLAHLFGSRDIPSTGFALGFDRIAELSQFKKEERGLIAVVSVKGYEKEAIKTARELRTRYQVVTDVMGRNMKNQLSNASDIGAKLAVIIGKEEVEQGFITVKNLETGKQWKSSIDELISGYEQFLE